MSVHAVIAMLTELTPDERLAVAEEAIRSARGGGVGASRPEGPGGVADARARRLLALGGSMSEETYAALEAALRDTGEIDGDGW